MRSPPYDVNATKQTVRVTIDSDLYARAKRHGINTSQIAEEALAREVARRDAELLTEIRQDLDACNAYTAKHGSFAEMAREHDDRREDES